MERLIVRNCGPIKEATVEVRKNTVFIGPHGSGKSTLAKLVALCTDRSIFPIGGLPADLLVNYNLESYVSSISYFRYETLMYYIEYKGKLTFNLTDFGLELNKKLVDQKRANNLDFTEWGFPSDFLSYSSTYNQKTKEQPPFRLQGISLV